MGTKARATGATPAGTPSPRPAPPTRSQGRSRSKSAPSKAAAPAPPTPPEAPEKNVGGRPPIEVTAADLRQLETMARNTIREDTMARILGWSPDTLMRRKKDTPEVLRALEKGYAEAELVVGNRLMGLATRGNLGAIIWIEKTRFGRREKMELSGPGGGPVTTEDLGQLTPEQRKARIAELMATGAARAAG